MKKSVPIQLFYGTCAAIAIFALGSCASNGYITSSINTGIGIDVSENPQTQVPHVKFGYIRTGLYYIPTGKVGDPVNGQASETPHVVSKIHVSSEFLKNIDISEKFAVGDKAVGSASAAQLFADTSTETKGKTVQAPKFASGDAPVKKVVLPPPTTDAIHVSGPSTEDRVKAAEKAIAEINALSLDDTAKKVFRDKVRAAVAMKKSVSFIDGISGEAKAAATPLPPLPH